MNINKFTDNLQQVISVAQEAAEMYGSSYIGSEHIVLAMLNCPDCTAYRVLESCNVYEPIFREIFVNSIDRRSNINGFTPRTKHMIERALELSIDLNGEDSLAGTEHMLLSVMSCTDCLAMKSFRAMGVNTSSLASKTELAVSGGLADVKDENEEDSFGSFSSLFSQQNKKPNKPKETKYSGQLDKNILQYGSDLTQKAREGKIAPVIGRKKEIDKIIQVLSR